ASSTARAISTAPLIAAPAGSPYSMPTKSRTDSGRVCGGFEVTGLIPGPAPSANGIFRGSGAAEGPVAHVAVGSRVGVRRVLGALDIGGPDRGDQALEGAEVAVGGCVESLLDPVVARDVDGVDRVHRVGVGLQRPPPVEPGVDAGQI